MLYAIILLVSTILEQHIKEDNIVAYIDQRFPPSTVVKDTLSFQKVRLDYLAFQIENGYGVKVDLLIEYEDLKERYRIWDMIDSIQLHKGNPHYRDELLEQLPLIIPDPINTSRFDDANR